MSAVRGAARAPQSAVLPSAETSASVGVTNIPAPAVFLSDSLSVYLDVVRFLAAFAVLVGHLDQDGGYAAWLVIGDFSHAAVVVFFVLSGLVISHAAYARQADWQAYVVARFARIYSVVLPAVALSFAIKAFAVWLDPVNLSAEFHANDLRLGNVLGSVFFLNEAWSVTTDLPWNGPFWSLCYEVWYYVIFGLVMFTRGATRGILTSLAALVAGPAILLLFPLWLLGVWLVKHGARCVVSPTLSRLIWGGSLVGFIVLNESGVDVALRMHLHDVLPGFWRLESAQRFVTDYCLGVLVAANFIAFRGLGPRAQRCMQVLKRPVVWLAGYTFSLYLFHRPLTHLVGHFMPNTAQNKALSVLWLLLILAVCFALGQVTEQRKQFFRALARRALGTLTR